MAIKSTRSRVEYTLFTSMTTLTCGLHDPEGGLLWTVEKHLNMLLNMFDQVVMTASPATDKVLLERLETHGCIVHRRSMNSAAQTCFDAIGHGLETGAEVIFYCDADRALHWARTYPEELRKVAKLATRTDYFIGMRGQQEYQSHHEALYYTEQLPNAIISQAMGEKKQHDYLSGCYGFSKKAATYIVKHMKANDFSMFGEWPLLMKRHGFAPTYRVCKGLEWETPDQHMDDVERCGSIEAYREWLSSPAEWKKRATMAMEFVKTLVPKS